MANLNELKKYLYYDFSSGPYTGQDYLTFQTKYINYLRSLCKTNGWELVNVGRGHYYFSAFIKNADGKHLYLSIDDVRGCNNHWYDRILIRTAAHAKDYRGGHNFYTSLTELTEKAERLFLLEHKGV